MPTLPTFCLTPSHALPTLQPNLETAFTATFPYFGTICPLPELLSSDVSSALPKETLLLLVVREYSGL